MRSIRSCHSGRGARRHQQDPARVGTLNDQMGDPMGEGVSLSGAGAADDEQGRCGQSAAGAVLDRTPLLGIP